MTECAPGLGIRDGVTKSLVDDGEVARGFADGQPCPAATPLGLFLVRSLNNLKSQQPEEILPPFSQVCSPSSWEPAPGAIPLQTESPECLGENWLNKRYKDFLYFS
uniref:Hexaribonucleotide binding protein 3 n=1 Tax=Homo sapiens TaxID=9606 RepID=Q4G0H5_HUMAN|nr:Hexaribonucleotide binding protein 3 [Homo sapiens]